MCTGSILQEEPEGNTDGNGLMLSYVADASIWCILPIVFHSTLLHVAFFQYRKSTIIPTELMSVNVIGVC